MAVQQRLLRLAIIASLYLWGCPSGESRYLAPAPTAAPGSAQVFVYVAETSDPVLGTSGGHVSVYQLGADGFLPAAPFASVPVVNPRRLVRHPVLPVLYVAGLNQIFAFDITGGTLTSLCGDGSLAPPCATDPRPGSDPLDMTIEPNDAGDYLLYVAEGGSGDNAALATRVAAYPLGPGGELPGNASSQASSFNAISYDGLAVVPGLGFAYVADGAAERLERWGLEPDGNLPYPPVSPTPIGAPTPTPTPPPTEPTPTPSPTPTAVRAFEPARMLQRAIPPSPSPDTGQQTVLYVVQKGKQKIFTYPLPTPIPDQPGTGGELSRDQSSESNTRGSYNAILIDPAATHIYAASFSYGQVDFYALAPDGNILPDTQGSTTPSDSDTTTYPTGLAWLEWVTPSGETQRTVFVSLGGANRIDAYQVQEDGSLAPKPFSSTQPIDGTSPGDVLVYVP